MQTGIAKWLMVAGSVCVIGYATWSLQKDESHHQEQESAFFSAALNRANVTDSVSVSGNEYKVINGKVTNGGQSIDGPLALAALRLAYAKTLARRTPLMALPNVSPDSLAVSIEMLERVQGDLSDIQTNGNDADAVRSSLYPMRFLKAMVSVIRARNAFLASGNGTDYAAYARAQRIAAATYERDAALFTDVYTHIVPTNATDYADAAYIINRKDVLEQMTVLRSGVRNTVERLNVRERCIGGITVDCDTKDLEFGALPELRVFAGSDKPDVEKELFAAITARPVNGMQFEPRAVRLTYSKCTDSYGAPLFAIRTLPQSRYTLIAPLFVGNMRLIREKDAESVDFGRALLSMGFRYVYSSPFVHYSCLAFPADYARLVSIVEIEDFIRSTHASAYASGGDYQLLSRLEWSIASSSQPVREEDVRAYMSALVHIPVSKYDDALRHAFEELYAEQVDQNAGFDQLLHFIARTEYEDISLMRINIPFTLDARYLFYARSAFLGLFMANNPSVVGPQAILLKPNTVPLSDQPYLRYSELSTIERARALSDRLRFLRMIGDVGDEIEK